VVFKKSILRFITCGSVDDGKSTLIGRLLYDTKLICEDQLFTLIEESKVIGTQKGEIDFALLVDGLAAEREQGITIDIAYRFFSTDRRKFIVADTPGHEEYTKNMATGASTADLSVILIDARKGILKQTKRHSLIVTLLGIKHIVIAVNKMDLMDYSEDVFEKIRQDYLEFAHDLNIENISFIPVSALKGENITNKSVLMDWYHGPSFIEFLETIDVNLNDISSETKKNAFRLPVQWINRPVPDFRGFSGTIASGNINIGDEITTLPSGQRSHVKAIFIGDKKQNSAYSDQAVTLTLEDEIDISRGDVISKPSDCPEMTDQFQAHIIWMHQNEMLSGRSYLFKTCNKTASGSITKINCKINVHDFSKEATKTLSMNEIGIANISLNELIVFDPFKVNRTMGSFIIIDRLSNDTVGCGMIDFGLRRASNIHWQNLTINAQTRATQKNQKPAVLWFTGLSGSGKSTIANLVEQKLYAMGKHTYLLDGDNIRHDLNRDLGFTDGDRVENIRRISEVAKLMCDAGLIVLTSFISPFYMERKIARDTFKDRFVEIYVDTNLEECERRDTKGLYQKARLGEIKNFTGINSPYEVPVNPDIHLRTEQSTAEDAAAIVIKYLKDKMLLQQH
jgi:bifunctional enzyme CysN/CysC